MDKTELKKILKPLIKSCIKEVLMEQGLLQIVSEAKSETHTTQNLVEQNFQSKNFNENTLEREKKVQEYRNKMLQEIGKSGYVADGFNPFANSSPIPGGEEPTMQESQSTPRNAPPAMNNIDPNDPGVNISGIMQMASGKWKAHLNRNKQKG